MTGASTIPDETAVIGESEDTNKLFQESLLGLSAAIETGDIVQIRRMLAVASQRANIVLVAAEKRKYQRHKLGPEQRLLVAPVENGCMPSRTSFYEVYGNDLSAGGVSFYSRHQVIETEYVILLGHPTSVIPMRAKVYHWSLIEVEETPRYLVCCKFIQRLRPQQSWTIPNST